jgi:hypothetical protein
VWEFPLIHGGGDFAFASAHDSAALIPLLHHEPLALVVVQLELPHGLGFGRPLIRGLNVAAILQPCAQNRDAPGAQCFFGWSLRSGHSANIGAGSEESNQRAAVLTASHARLNCCLASASEPTLLSVRTPSRGGTYRVIDQRHISSGGVLVSDPHKYARQFARHRARSSPPSPHRKERPSRSDPW